MYTQEQQQQQCRNRKKLLLRNGKEYSKNSGDGSQHLASSMSFMAPASNSDRIGIQSAVTNTIRSGLFCIFLNNAHTLNTSEAISRLAYFKRAHIQQENRFETTGVPLVYRPTLSEDDM